MTSSPAIRQVEADRRSKSSKIWIALSFTLSALILGWAFSLPFQQSGTSMVSSVQADEHGPTLRRSAQIAKRRTTAEEFRQSAIELDKKFMQSIQRKRDAENRPRAGINAARTRWQHHVKSVNAEIHMYRHAKKGTVEWEHRQSLLRSLEDGPR